MYIVLFEQSRGCIFLNSNPQHLGFPSQNYQYSGTLLDTRRMLSMATSNEVPQMAEIAAQFAGHMVLRLVHDHLLQLDLMKYDKVIRHNVAQINMKVKAVQRVGVQFTTN